jgi:glyoxylase-like metal-dependent hydrolase (beta-lactamase superfamily II)
MGGVPLRLAPRGARAVAARAGEADSHRAAPGLRVCWLETGKLLDNTASGLLVRHPKGDFLVDAGNSTRFADDIYVYRKTKWLWMRTVPGALAPSRSIAEALTAVGADPAKIQLLPTHAHLDHVGGIVDLPPATPVLLAPAEIDWVNGARGREVEGLVPAHVTRLDGHMTPIAFKPEPYEIFDSHADLFGDGSVVVVPLSGHTPGSVGVFVSLSPTRRLFHIGADSPIRRF